MHTNSVWRRPAACLYGLVLFGSAAVQADDTSGRTPVRADTHAPIGVMGEHTHNKGEWMLSYRFMRMDMQGNAIGTRSVSPDEIVTTVGNPFFGQPGQPPTLRVVPLSMTMDMHMFGAMYAPNDRVTLMGMVNYLEKEMDHTTYQGPVGTNVLGTFTTKSSGLGDTSVGALVRLVEQPTQKWHANIGISLPTGDIEKTDQVLAPNGNQPVLRMPYAMQLGSGTVDLKPGITYNGRRDNLTWGAQYIATLRLGKNNEDYSLGDVQQLTAWTAYSPAPSWSVAARLAWEDIGRIDGMDPAIMAPVQTAVPNNYGGQSWYAFLSANVAGQSGWRRGHRLAIEFGIPLRQDLNGPQMETDWSATAGWQYAF